MNGDQGNKPVKRLYRSQTDKKWLGVCGGIAHYFGIDPVLVRLLWVIVTIATGIVPGVIVYLVAAMVMPKEPI